MFWLFWHERYRSNICDEDVTISRWNLEVVFVLYKYLDTIRFSITIVLELYKLWHVFTFSLYFQRKCGT